MQGIEQFSKRGSSASSGGADGHLMASTPVDPARETLERFAVRLDGNIVRRKAPRTDTIYWDKDLPGLGLRCRASGRKTWVLRYRERAKQRLKTLGSAAQLLPRQAQRQAKEILRSIALDGLPQKPIATVTTGLTLEEYAGEFMRCCEGRWKASTAKRNEWAIHAHILPLLGQVSVAGATLADIMKWRDEMGQKTAAFNRAVPVLSAMFVQAETLGYRRPGSNPCRGIARYKRKLPERYLSPSEYRALGAALSDAEEECGEAVSIIRLLIYTGARVSEIAGLRWEWIKPPRVFLPDSKTGARVIYLNAPACEILDKYRGVHESGLVFSGPRRSDRAFNPVPAWIAIRARA